jgi:hypothetical protein
MAPMTARPRLRAAVAGVLALVATAQAQAQRSSLPLDDIAYTYIDALQARGLLRELPIIERPYTVGAVRAAVTAARRALHDAGAVRWLLEIERAADKYAPGVTEADSAVIAAGVGAYGIGQTSGNRDLMQSDRKDAFAPGFTVRLLLDAGPFTGAVRVRADRAMKVDPEYFGRRDQWVAARTEDAYLGVSSKFATVQIGRLARSWALPGQFGLMLSNGPYTYDHLYLRLGSDRIHLASVLARLDDERLNFTSDTMAQRYFMAHRVGLHLGSIEAGVSESVVYGGVGRGFTPSLSNPVTPVFLAQYSDGQSVNMAFGADALWRSRTGVTLGGQVFVDDFQVDTCALCGKPPAIGATFTSSGIPLAGGARAFASYTRVNSLTYRNFKRYERYTYSGLSLGQRNSDFDELRAGIDVGPMLPAPLRLYAAYRRQGAGDYREPFPPDSLINTWPTIFEGVVVKTFRVAASGALRLGRAIEITGDAGLNHSDNDLRVPGATKTRFEGRVRVALEPSWARLRASLVQSAP